MQAPTALLAGRYRFKAKVDAGTKSPTWIATEEQNRREVVAAALGAARVAALMGVVGLRHQHLAAIVEVVDNPDPAAVPGPSQAGAAVLVAEYVAGKTLHAQLKQARLTPAEAVTLWIRLCRGVSALHAAGGAHGAISPRSIVVEPSGGRQPPVLTQLLSPTSGAYCAPERLQGRGPSSADDTWALHAVLYAALTGGPPFRGDTKDQLLQSIASGQVGRIADHGIRDDSLQEIISAGLVANLARRRSGIAELLEALERWEPKSERGARASDWEEDAETVVASSSEEVAAMMRSDPGVSSPRVPPVHAVPSMPPVPVSDYEDHRDHAAELPDASPRNYEDEDDATTVMGRGPVEEVRRRVATGSGPKPGPPPRRAPPPPGFAAPSLEGTGESDDPFGHTTPYVHSPFDGEAPPEIPSVARPTPPAPPPAQPLGYQPHAGAFPPTTSSAYPPSIPAPGPTGIQVPLDDVEFRSPSRKPLVVIAILLVLIALSMTVLLILNYRGVIT